MNAFSFLRFSIATTIALVVALSAACGQTTNKYVGVKICSMCHKADKTGNQFAIWQKSKHATAYATLTTPTADSVAKAKGLKKPAAQSPECLQCHTINADVALLDKTCDLKDGVQCEVCHGPGSTYKSITIMKDTAKARAAGLLAYKDNAAIAKQCTTCHNNKSPYYKSFKFDDMWAKIKHSVPKS